MARGCASVALWALLCTLGAAQVRLGALTMVDHDVSGEVFALDARTLEIREFVYDGGGPDAFFWGDEGAEASAAGELLPERPGCGAARLPRYRGETVVVEMPAGKTIADYRHISVWCRRFSVTFGGMDIDPALLAGLPAAAEGQECSTAESGGEAGGDAGDEPFPVAEGFNCEQLEEDLQVRWTVNAAAETVTVELVGRIADNQYMGFGPSGSDTATNMVGSDPAIAFLDTTVEYVARDFFMSSRGQCSDGDGVCPDEDFGAANGDQFTDVAGSRSADLVSVKYTRPLAATDPATDRSISVAAGATTFISWAIGPIQSLSATDDAADLLPLYHQTRTVPRGESVGFEFGRAALNSCSQMVTQGAAQSADLSQEEPYDRPVLPLEEGDTVYARIGNAGGDRGREAVAQQQGWGIAWYLSNGQEEQPILVGTLGVERGKTYTFKVQGGDDPDVGENFHPFYITSSETGGPEAVGSETIYAGPVEGALCRLQGGDSTAETYDEFYADVDASCTTNETITAGIGTLNWTVAADTPDMVYYQCRTHALLGWRIVVADEGALTRAAVEAANVAPREQQSGEGATETCEVDFKGETKTFAGCRKSLEFGMEVYWTIDEDAGTIQTLFQGTPDDGGYVGWGWGTSEMIVSNAAIAYVDPSSGEPSIQDYRMVRRESAGVQPGDDQGLTDAEADLATDGTMKGLFTRPLSGNIQNGETPAIFAVGPRVSGPTSLAQHSQRSTITIDLSQTTGNETGGVSLRTVWKIHGALMGIAWLVLAPIGIFVMRYCKKFNPAAFRSHQMILLLAFIMAVVAYILALKEGARTEKSHFSIGTIIIVLALLQAIAGFFRPAKGTPKRRAFYLGHSMNGRLVWLLAAVNCFIGLNIANARTYWKALSGVSVALTVILFVVFGVFLKEQFPSKEEDSTTSADNRSEEPADL